MTGVAGQRICPQGLGALLARLRERTGIDVPSSRLAMSASAVRRAMAAAEVRDLDQYRALLDRDESAFDALVEEMTVGETYFFREPRQLAFLRDVAVPDIVGRRGPQHVVSAWSAGCASGEEPYSIAILLHEAGLVGRTRVVGTDLSRRRLATARGGRYGKWSLRGVGPEVVSRYFRRAGTAWDLAPAIRSAVRFAHHNLADGADAAGIGGSLDLIVCRNVLIYLDAATIERIARQFVERLAIGGWLLLGASDPPLPNSLPCEVVMTTAGLAYRRVDRARRAAAPAKPPVEYRRRASWVHTEPVRADDVPPARAVPEPRPAAEPVPPRVVTAELLAEATHAYVTGNYAEAATTAERYLRAGGGSVEGWVTMVRALANAGRASAAALACAAALEAHPLCAELPVLQSLVLAELGEHAAAVEAARRAVYLDRELVVAHLAHGAALVRVADERGARRAFANGLRLLERIPPTAIVPSSGGESAARLEQLARSQLQMLTRRAG